MDRKRLVERLKKTRDPDERNRILEVLSSHHGEDAPGGVGAPGSVPGRKKALSGVFLGYVVGAFFLAGGSLMVYKGIIALSEGSKRGGIVTFFIVGAVLLILGILAVFKAGRPREIPAETPSEADKKDIFRMEP